MQPSALLYLAGHGSLSLTRRNSSWLWSVQVLYAGAKMPACSLLPGHTVIAAGDELYSIT